MNKPLHPMFVHFPLALLATSFAADATFAFTHWASLRDAGWWMILAASAGGIVAVLAGLRDMRATTLSEATHRRVHQHMGVGLLLLAAIVGLTLWRWVFYRDATAPSIVYLDFAFFAVLVALFQGWLGGELVYSHAVFVARGEEKPKDRSAHEPEHASGSPHAHH